MADHDMRTYNVAHRFVPKTTPHQVVSVLLHMRHHIDGLTTLERDALADAIAIIENK